MAADNAAILTSKIIDSIESLWLKVVQLESHFAPALFIDTLLTIEEQYKIYEIVHPTLENAPPELLEVYKFLDDDVWQKIYDSEAFKDYERPFVGTKLWQIYFVTRSFLGRSGMLVRFSIQRKKYVNWRNDEIIYPFTSIVLGEETLSQARQMAGGGLRFIMSQLIVEFNKEAAQMMCFPKRLVELSTDDQGLPSHKGDFGPGTRIGFGQG